ncbi:uncharacterized protein PV09_08786 [Verruconis gallopava]|uniref:Mid2 domain-containing protein n=1 Tax=Verruconis gallopava TaxID=253628 RepID=A0A0D1YFT9_9PEZI|nr:uncharacterized protein PV09_08786 [Verruconis gallopava]KIV99611.1 hypothetical protein PV09_08786 [Verruconis gallopava]
MPSFLLAAICVFAAYAQSINPSATTTAAISPPTKGYCYYPNHNSTAAYDDRPCDPYAETSMCCPNGWTCMSNKLCVVTDDSIAKASVGSIERGTCTDPSWNDTICGNFCLNQNGNNTDGALRACGNNRFVCAVDEEDSTGNCEKNLKVFTLPTGTAVTIIGLATGTTSTSIVPVSSLVSGSAFASSASSSFASSPSAAPAGGSNKSHKTRDIAIGATIGSVSLIVFLLLIICLIHKKRKKSRTSLNSNLSHEHERLHQSASAADVYPSNTNPASSSTTEPVRESTVPTPIPVAVEEKVPEPKHHILYNDNEDEIANGIGNPTTALTAPQTGPARNASALDVTDRELAGIKGRAFIEEEPLTSSERPDAVDISTFDGSRSSLLHPGKATPSS